jgi:ribose transport system ATP-binding protein
MAAETRQPSDPLLDVRGLSKAYPGVQALDAVDFSLGPGEVHALVGENGAGKSTLSKVIAGIERAAAGTMLLGGAAYAPHDRRHAERCGVRIVLQELNLIPTLSVAENLFLEDLPARWGWVDYGRLHAEAARAMAGVGLEDVRPEVPVGELGVGRQQLVEIAAGLAHPCKVLILDEPTAALTEAERELLFAHLARLRASGVGVIYISHRLDEIRRVADRVTVLRDGRVVAGAPAASTTREQVIGWMVGRELRDPYPPRTSQPGEVVLEVRGLCRGAAVRGVSLELRRGEILGLAGLMGAGRTELVRALFGADAAEAGEVRLHGRARPWRFRSPAQAVRQGLALLTENRKEQGLLLPLGVRANTTLARLCAVARPGGWISRSAESAAASQLAGLLSLRCRSLEQPVNELSGGNQQKVIAARWLHRDSDVLIVDEPTRGIDVAARHEMYRLLDRLAADGKAILMVSSDLDELLGLCDRIAVVSAGRIAAVFRRGQWSREAIMAAALSGYARTVPGAAEVPAPRVDGSRLKGSTTNGLPPRDSMRL